MTADHIEGPDDVLRLDARAQARALRSGTVGARELVEAAITRIERVNPAVNAISWTDYDLALAEADAWQPSDAPFGGVPILLKDHRCLGAGEQTRFGTTALAERPLPWTAGSNARRAVSEAGFIVLGRTTAPEFATALVTECVATGVTRNPVALDRTSGGSSGGSASAVASGMVAVAHATDGGGSIRVPASICGLVGLKPSRGRVSLGPDGESWAGASVEGVISRTVGDAAAVTASLSRWYPGDPYVAPGEVPAVPQVLGRRLRIGVQYEDPLGGPWPSADVTAALERTADVLTVRGHDVVDSAPTALRVMEFSARYDTVIDADVELLARRIERHLGRKLTDGELSPRNVAKRASATAMGADHYLETRYWLTNWAYDLQGWWWGSDDGSEYDLLMTPTLGGLPALAGTAGDDQGITDRSAQMRAMTSFANVAGLPAISLPLAVSASGLPIGLQFVGRFGAEDLLLALAADFETSGPWEATDPFTLDF